MCGNPHGVDVAPRMSPGAEGHKATRAAPTVHEAQGEPEPLLRRHRGAEREPCGMHGTAAHVAPPKGKQWELPGVAAAPQGHGSTGTAPTAHLG